MPKQSPQPDADKAASGGVTLPMVAPNKDMSLLDVMKFAETMARQMQMFHEALDTSLFREFQEISAFISSMRTEIGRLQASDLSETRIPLAGEELDAIVSSTEDATNTIMESAEEIMSADPDDFATYQDVVNDNVMKIFEACSFQDLTGQRISRVVETLQLIEKRVDKFASAIGAIDEIDSRTEEEKERDRRREELILNGPQDKGDAIEQGAVDSMFDAPGGGDEAKASDKDGKDGDQVDIDAMFN